MGIAQNIQPRAADTRPPARAFPLDLCLIVGALRGVAAFFGGCMNLNYILAGAISTIPLLGFLGLYLILAWRIAGYYGVERYLLPLLGTPWTGSLARKTEAPSATGERRPQRPRRFSCAI